MSSPPPWSCCPAAAPRWPTARAFTSRAAAEARELFERGPVLVAHAAMTARRLELPAPPRSPRLFDVLELFAFARPARFCAPSAAGLALAARAARARRRRRPGRGPARGRRRLLAELAAAPTPSREEALAQAETLGRAGWAWAAPAIGRPAVARRWAGPGAAPASTSGAGWPSGRIRPRRASRARGRSIRQAASAWLAELLQRSGLDEARPRQARVSPPRPPTPSSRASARASR